MRHTGNDLMMSGPSCKQKLWCTAYTKGFTSTSYKVLYEKVFTTIAALMDQQVMALGNRELCSLLPTMPELQDKKYTRPQMPIQGCRMLSQIKQYKLCVLRYTKQGKNKKEITLLRRLYQQADSQTFYPC